MKKIILFGLLLFATPAYAQKVETVCYQTPSGTPICQIVTTTTPLPVTPE